MKNAFAYLLDFLHDEELSDLACHIDIAKGTHRVESVQNGTWNTEAAFELDVEFIDMRAAVANEEIKRRK